MYTTMRAMALIERAVELADAQFPGDALEEACRSRPVRRGWLCCASCSHARRCSALFGEPATPQQVIAALRETVRGAPARLLASA